MKKSQRCAGRTKPKRSFGVTRGNLGHGANITRDAIGLHGDSAAPTSNPLPLETQTIAVVPMDTDRVNSNFSQGKISDPDAITKYADAIGGNWRSGVEAFLEIGRLCAEADKRLDPAQQAELKAKLPFSEATFSKFRQIGLDARLRKPEVQRLLPAAYTTIYAISRLKNDEDLSAAITENIIGPDMKRVKFEKWRKEREAARQQKANAPDDAAASAANSVSLAAGNSVDVGVGEPSVPGEAVETAWLVRPAPSEPIPGAATDDVEILSPSVAPTGDESSVLDGLSLSVDDQAVLDLLNTTWDRASDPVRTQFHARIRE